MKRVMNPPESIEIDGCSYKIRTNFGVWIEAESLLTGADAQGVEILARVLALVYEELPPDPIKALKGVLWFRSGGKPFASADHDRGRNIKAYDLKLDFPYIWAAFIEQYGIDLTVQTLHWWRFRVLLECLRDDCRFARIVEYRTASIGDIKDQRVKNFYMRMKKQYRLPCTEEQAESKIAAAFEAALGG